MDNGASVPDPALVSDQAPAGLAAPRFDPSRVAEAVALVEASKLLPIVRKAADEFYDQLYTSVEDYLKENLDYNITQHIAMLERENRRMSRELYEVDQIVGSPWLSHATRIERLRGMDRDVSELSVLKFKIALESAQAMSAGTAETQQAAQGEGRQRGPKDAPTPSSHPQGQQDRSDDN